MNKWYGSSFFAIVIGMLSAGWVLPFTLAALSILEYFISKDSGRLDSFPYLSFAQLMLKTAAAWLAICICCWSAIAWKALAVR
ncbi:MAG: hypothetical protein JSS27_20050 [Planctomycetes bacterium]|nr:hypothetical protein [Planctomycetota bacterium]